MLVEYPIRCNYVFFLYNPSVCNAGYYKSGSSCEQCTGNKIKTMVGDATNCGADEPCDGVGEVPNSNHTACGKSKDLTLNSMLPALNKPLSKNIFYFDQTYLNWDGSRIILGWGADSKGTEAPTHFQKKRMKSRELSPEDISISAVAECQMSDVTPT